MVNKLWNSVALLIGTTIGAGFLGIPYVFAKAGFLVGGIHLLLVTLIMIFLNLYLGEISLRTKGDHQLTGYAEKYLGVFGRKVMFFTLVFGIYTALLAYLIGEGNSLSFIFFGTTKYTLIIGIAFWLIMAIITSSGMKALRKYEPISVSLVLLTTLLIFGLLMGNMNTENLFFINSNYLFLPFGVILFSMLGYTVMPEMELVLKKNEKYMKKAIVLGTCIPAFVYLLFAVSVAGNFGQNTPEIATLALGKIFVLLGILAIFTAYLALSVSIENIYHLDYKLSKRRSWFLAVFIPLILFLILEITQKSSFVNVLGMTGVISGGLGGILILLMNIKAKKKGNRKPEYKIPISKTIVLIFSIIFIAGVIFEIFVK